MKFSKTLLHNCSLLFFFLISFGSSEVNSQGRGRIFVEGREIDADRRTPSEDANLQVSSDVCPETNFRNFDGTCNNVSQLNRIEWGASDVSLMRTMLPLYGSEDHYNAMSGESRPSPRAISNALFEQTDDTPSQRSLSSFVFTWGQFLDHDISLTPEGHEEYEPISMPDDEPLFTSSIPFFRSSIYEGSGDGNYREQINLITSYIDGSNVYGADQDRADWLRTFINGKLKVSEGDLLPYNTTDAQLDSDIDASAPSMAGDNGGTAKIFVAGDVRAAEQPGLTSLHTLFVRYHNNICDRLLSEGIVQDEELYQRARKEVGATIQAITYNEFLPSLGVRLEGSRGYNANVRSDISNIFATAAYRLGHTMVTDELLLKTDQCQDVNGGSVSLLEGFFNPQVVATNNIEPILSGLAVQLQNAVDLQIIDNLRNFLFGDPSSGNAAGLDLASLNIQRGRDHGLPDYNTVRRHYTGRGIRNIRDISRNRQTRDGLSEMYEDVNDIDLWVGLLAEDKENGTSLGRTLHAIMSDQFERLRDGDRYFYLHDRSLSRRDRNRIERTKLSDVIRASTGIQTIQDNVFLVQECNSAQSNSELQEDSAIAATRSFEIEENPAELKIFPNPTTNIINVEFDNRSNIMFDIKIVDLTGQIVKNFTTNQSIAKVNVTSLSEGIYTILISNGDTLLTERFVKVEY